MKKRLALLLTITMVVSLIGCGGSDAATSSLQVDNESNVSADEPKEKEEAAGEITEGKVNEAQVTFSKESEDRLKVEADAANAVNLYIVADAYLNKFLAYDAQNGNEEEYKQLLENAIKAYENVGIVSSALSKEAGELEKAESDEAYSGADGSGAFKETAYIGTSYKKSWDPFVLTVYAAQESEAVKWAKDITERFDKAPAGKGIRTLAEQMGTDAKHAYAQLKQAQDILAGDAYGNFADRADACYKTAKVLKTAGTAAQLTLSVITANPTSTIDAIMTSGGIVINGMNTMLEVGQTGSLLIVGDDNRVSKKLEDMEDALAPIGATIGLYGFSSNLLKGKKLAEDAPALADTLMYLGTSIYDYAADGKILGGTFTEGTDGTISCTFVDTMSAKTALSSDATKEEVAESIEKVMGTVGYDKGVIDSVTSEILAGKMAEEAADTSEGVDTMSDEYFDLIFDSMEDLSPESYSVPAEILEASDASFIEEADVEGLEASDASFIEEADVEGQEDEADSKAGEFPTASEVCGFYNFITHVTMGDQEADGELPNDITCEGGNNLAMTDDSITIRGTYNPDTGKVTFTDTDGTAVNVQFTYNDDGSIHAKFRANADGISMTGSANKK